VRDAPVNQFDLFGAPDPLERVGVAEVAADVSQIAQALPSELRLGTSSWSFPGWAGLVYGRRVGESVLARDGLRAYSRHGLFSAVGLDRTFYAPISVDDYRRLAEQVPANFRFLVKAHAAITTPPESPRGLEDVEDGQRFLDAVYATERVVRPAVEGLGERLGVILFQFPPLGIRSSEGVRAVLARLDGFLGGLPRGPRYAIEVRNEAFLSLDYGEILSRHQVAHCFNVHPRMPSVLAQYDRLEKWLGASSSAVVRWMLNPTLEYEAARKRYFPFDRVVDADAVRRQELAELIEKLLFAGRKIIVIANNKAEGSAPLSLEALARELSVRNGWRTASS
jgi:uncharacterized protein YecE (DUF72 family)